MDVVCAIESAADSSESEQCCACCAADGRCRAISECEPFPCFMFSISCRSGSEVLHGFACQQSGKFMLHNSGVHSRQ